MDCDRAGVDYSCDLKTNAPADSNFDMITCVQSGFFAYFVFLILPQEMMPADHKRREPAV